MFLSVKMKVIATAKTGKDNNNKIFVINIHQMKIRTLINSVNSNLLLYIVVMKLIDPNKEEIPAKSNENIKISTEVDEE